MYMAMRIGLLCFLSVILVAIFLVAAGLKDDLHVSDVGIVLGSKVMADGSPSPRLQARLDRAAELYNQGYFKKIIVSGGTGHEGFSEARVMAAALEAAGVPSAAILLDEVGNNTRATAQNAAAIMAEGGMTSALLVTQYFHVPRTRLALKQAGIVDVYSAHAHFFEARDIYSVIRELAALPGYWLGSR